MVHSMFVRILVVIEVGYPLYDILEAFCRIGLVHIAQMIGLSLLACSKTQSQAGSLATELLSVEHSMMISYLHDCNIDRTVPIIVTCSTSTITYTCTIT